RDVSAVNHTTASRLRLWNNGAGAYVNRWGANGDQWIVTAKADYCGNVDRPMLDAMGNPIPCTSRDAQETACTMMDAMMRTRLSCNIEGNNYTAIYRIAALDGTPTFFPIDADNFSP